MPTIATDCESVETSRYVVIPPIEGEGVLLSPAWTEHVLQFLISQVCLFVCFRSCLVKWLTLENEKKLLFLRIGGIIWKNLVIKVLVSYICSLLKLGLEYIVAVLS